jgi:predicted Zn-dependent protease
MRGLALVLLATLASGCAAPRSVSIAPPAAPDAQERILLERVARHDGAELADLLTRVATALLFDSERTAPEIVVLRDPSINAFVLSSGRVYLHTGLLVRLGNEAQLATVLGRALAHAARPEALERAAAPGRMDEALLTMSSTIGASLATASTEPRVLSPVAEAALGANLSAVYVAAVTGYGRDLEHAADADAIRRLVRAGYDPKEAPRTFERLRREAKTGGALERFFLGTDAALAERAQRLGRLVTDEYAVAAATPDTIKGTPHFQEVMAAVARDNARLELRMGRFAAAQEQVDRALAVSPADAQAYLALGELLRLRAQRARGAADRDELARQALGAYERSASLDPGLAEVVRELGLLYYQQGQLERAREAFTRYVTLSPGAPDVPRVHEYIAILTR